MSTDLDSNREKVLKLKSNWDDALALEIFEQNLGFARKIALNYCRGRVEYEDLLQVAYLAFLDAVKVFSRESEYFFITYYRVSLKKHYLEYCRRNQFSVTISQKTFSSIINGELKIEEVYDDFEYGEDTWDIVDDGLIREVFWAKMKSLLNEKNYYVMYEYFVKGRTMASIGRSLGIGKERVRTRILRSLNLLRYSKWFRELAKSAGCYHVQKD